MEINVNKIYSQFIYDSAPIGKMVNTKKNLQDYISESALTGSCINSGIRKRVENSDSMVVVWQEHKQ